MFSFRANSKWFHTCKKSNLCYYFGFLTHLSKPHDNTDIDLKRLLGKAFPVISLLWLQKWCVSSSLCDKLKSSCSADSVQSWAWQTVHRKDTVPRLLILHLPHFLPNEESPFISTGTDSHWLPIFASASLPYSLCITSQIIQASLFWVFSINGNRKHRVPGELDENLKNIKPKFNISISYDATHGMLKKI